jgi:hypothetical protein
MRELGFDTDIDDVAERCRHLNERRRARCIAGAEEEWRRRTGRPMTSEELERVLRGYPGDVWAGSVNIDGDRDRS